MQKAKEARLPPWVPKESNRVAVAPTKRVNNRTRDAFSGETSMERATFEKDNESILRASMTLEKTNRAPLVASNRW